MYKYTAQDSQLIKERAAQFRDQTRRYFAGELAGDEFRPLRLQNGLYVQRHAPMLRIAIPYGMISSAQLRRLGHVARTWDKGYAHFTTRHNLQYNWPKLEDVPDILESLAEVEMHGIQTSGNCIRNISTDQFAGVAPDEIIDPRPWAEILRQWSTLHPEFAYLPRKFKIAINGAVSDRAALRVHDVALNVLKNEAGEIGFQVLAGGGMGRTPILAPVIKDFLPWQHIISYLEAVLRVYNRYGRRDNPYKARIKILVKALGTEEFARQVEEEWAHSKDGPNTLTQAEVERVSAHFTAPAYEQLAEPVPSFDLARNNDKAFARWVERNVHGHKVPGYAAVTISLKAPHLAPGDATAEQMDQVADLADRYSFGELRSSHEQNLILADVKKAELFALWQELKSFGLATPTVGLLTDIICCPGGDFCDLANAKSIPIANGIQAAFEDLDYLHDIGELDLNISGCMNSCGHHHIGNIGILGVDKTGSEWYQVSLGGRQGNDTRLGHVIGPSFAADEVPGVITDIIRVYLDNRTDEELFIDTFDRIGLQPFKDRVYATRSRSKERKVANV